jgi:hypothetical protein
MSIKRTLLCIHKDATQFEQRKLLLENNQYQILGASTDQDALPLLMERRVDAIVIECTNDSSMARKLKQIAPGVPVIAVVNSLDVPIPDVDSIDALVGSFDGPQFLLDTLHFVLEVRPRQFCSGAYKNTKSIRQRFANSTASEWRARIGA